MAQPWAGWLQRVLRQGLGKRREEEGLLNTHAHRKRVGVPVRWPWVSVVTAPDIQLFDSGFPRPCTGQGGGFTPDCYEQNPGLDRALAFRGRGDWALGAL